MNLVKRFMTTGGKARLRVVAASAALVLALGAVSAYAYFGRRVSTDDAQVDAHIAPIASKVGGNVSEILVADNQIVHAGDVLLRIDARDYQARVDQACAQLAAAESQARGANAGVPLTNATTASGTSAAAAQLSAAYADHERAVVDYERASSSELAVAKADVEAKRATADRAHADLDRMAPLAAKNEISKLQFDAFVAGQRVAASELAAAEQKLANAQKQAKSSKALMAVSEARVEAARAMLAQATANRRQVDISAAQAGSAAAAIQQAQAAVHAAELELSYTSLTAPIDGIVTKKTIQLGQIVQPGQSLLTIVPLADVWVTANFKETQLSAVRAGQRAEVRVDTYGRSFEGYVDSIAGATGAKLSLLPPENATGNFVKIVQRIPVKVALDKVPDGVVLRPGMNVDVTIFTR
jgi:membrane fusion protein, multidrug efflux system